MKLDIAQSVVANTVITAEFSIPGMFNPSTFPNVGRLMFQREGQPCLVLDSFASVTNMLEGTVQLPGTEAPIFADLPHIRMVDQHGVYQATSITLPHRLASGYLLKNSSAMLGTERFDKTIKTEIEKNGLHATVLKYCPMSLLHGVWFSQLEGGNHKIAKAVSGSLIAINVQTAMAGGVSMDTVWKSAESLDLSAFEGAKKASEVGVGMIPHSTMRYVCDRVMGDFQIGGQQIDSYKIHESGKVLLKALALYEVLTFLETVPMHRSDCNMVVKSVDVNQDLVAKTAKDAAEQVQSAIVEAIKAGVLGTTQTVTVKLQEKKPEKKAKS